MKQKNITRKYIATLVLGIVTFTMVFAVSVNTASVNAQSCDTSAAEAKAKAALNWHKAHGSNTLMFWKIMNVLDQDHTIAKPSDTDPTNSTGDKIEAEKLEGFITNWTPNDSSDDKKWGGWNIILPAVKCVAPASTVIQDAQTQRDTQQLQVSVITGNHWFGQSGSRSTVQPESYIQEGDSTLIGNIWLNMPDANTMPENGIVEIEARTYSGTEANKASVTWGAWRPAGEVVSSGSPASGPYSASLRAEGCPNTDSCVGPNEIQPWKRQSANSKFWSLPISIHHVDNNIVGEPYTWLQLRVKNSTDTRYLTVRWSDDDRSTVMVKTVPSRGVKAAYAIFTRNYTYNSLGGAADPNHGLYMGRQRLYLYPKTAGASGNNLSIEFSDVAASNAAPTLTSDELGSGCSTTCLMISFGQKHDARSWNAQEWASWINDNSTKWTAKAFGVYTETIAVDGFRMDHGGIFAGTGNIQGGRATTSRGSGSSQGTVKIGFSKPVERDFVITVTGVNNNGQTTNYRLTVSAEVTKRGGYINVADLPYDGNPSANLGDVQQGFCRSTAAASEVLQASTWGAERDSSTAPGIRFRVSQDINLCQM